jgi:hypothetical protein
MLMMLPATVSRVIGKTDALISSLLRRFRSGDLLGFQSSDQSSKKLCGD